ncbi:MAG: PIN/TRAM domain-containing protein [Candidatus Paralactobacillus gallistercoris]|uniref:PIN/TRAM domain-containing protein n=1 Tax=Candidatus Paralactobacillus gallistercoris TaxID=2838724 RepID=A0A948TJG8_9LACO|nr:PIN/TRAM domain-containing protein [Candidatus Paralactobacillus gallistercoris]
MRRHIVIILSTLIGLGTGIWFLPKLWAVMGLGNLFLLNNNVTNGIIGAIIFALLSLLFVNPLLTQFRKIENYLAKQTPAYLFFGVIFLIVGLVLANIISVPLYHTHIFLTNTLIPITLMVVLGYLGFRLGTTRRKEWGHVFRLHRRNGDKENEAVKGEILSQDSGENFHRYKLLDTSVIIDGRIYDIAKTGFVEGTLLVPTFVLHELQLISDSADSIKRVRGRRGLDILNQMQKDPAMHIQMYDGDFEDTKEVDTKLVKLAKMIDGIVVTNDFNLSKVCEFQKVPVLNINKLASILKPVVLPGEKMTVTVIKAGTERQQGVAYLDDGTMIVVEEGQKYLNKTLEVIVTSALQTAAGRMIFAKPAQLTKSLKTGTNK